MALPTSGEISWQDIQDEHGGSHPISISEYYGKYTIANSQGPTSGVLTASNLYGTAPSVNGDWTAFGGYSNAGGYSDGSGGTCSVSCGTGTQMKSRACTSPAPSYGGSDCAGSATESRACNTQSCWTATVATGGTITTDGDYKIHTFTGSGTFAVQTAGDDNVDYLIIAGGGAQGSQAGGGGAGGYKTSYGSETSGGSCGNQASVSVSATSYSIVVGGGGAGHSGYTNFGSGSASSALGVSTVGGGGAGGSCENGKSGGSGGGAGRNSKCNRSGGGASGCGNSGYGNSGSAGLGGGGGGSNSGGSGNNGGSGLTSYITGTGVARAGGGANYYSGSSYHQFANSGSGRGGTWSTSAHGYSGVVIIRYKYQ